MAINKQELADLIGEIGKEADHEIESKREAQLSKEDKVLQKLANEILLLERDMTQPGNPVQEKTRIKRLMEFIDKVDF